MPEVAEDRLKALTNAEGLLAELAADGTLGATVRERVKAKFPDARFAEDRVDPMVAPLRDEIAALKAEREADKAEREAEKKAREEERFNSDFASKVDRAVSAYKLNDDGKTKMLERMKETGNIYDPDAAAAWVAGQEPPPPRIGPSWAPQQANFFGESEESQDAKVRLLHKNPERFFDQEVAEILNEFAAADAA